MANRIELSFGSRTLTVVLNDSPTAKALWEALPIDGAADRWGEEIYFEIPLRVRAEKSARTAMKVGEVAYWPQGRAFCLFFGPTPASRDGEPTAASPVNPLGVMERVPSWLGSVEDGESIRIERLG